MCNDAPKDCHLKAILSMKRSYRLMYQVPTEQKQKKKTQIGRDGSRLVCYQLKLAVPARVVLARMYGLIPARSIQGARSLGKAVRCILVRLLPDR